MQRLSGKLGYALSGLTGFLLGWLVMGWLVWPVQYVGDAYTYELNQADRQRYVEAIVDSFTLTQIANPDWFTGWTPEELADTLTAVSQQPSRAAGAYTLAAQQGMTLGVVSQPLAVANQTSGMDFGLILKAFLVGMGATVFVFLATKLVAYLGRRIEPTFKTQSHGYEFKENPPVWTEPASKPKEPLTGTPARFIYQAGEPFDKSLPIERDGETLGEYGMSKIEEADAFDVWLYDPRDLRTVTKVLANQPSPEIASRGPFLSAREGQEFELSTALLYLRGRVTGVVLDDNGGFARLTVELCAREVMDD